MNHIDKKIARLEKELAEAKAEKEKMWPKYGDEYFEIDLDGTIWDEKWTDEETDHNQLMIGNVFRTEEEAERKFLCLRARKKFLDHGGHEGLEGLPEECYFAGLTTEERLYIASGSLPTAFEIWFMSEEDCQSAINSLTDDEVEALCWQGGEE